MGLAGVLPLIVQALLPPPLRNLGRATKVQMDIGGNQILNPPAFGVGIAAIVVPKAIERIGWNGVEARAVKFMAPQHLRFRDPGRG